MIQRGGWSHNPLSSLSPLEGVSLSHRPPRKKSLRALELKSTLRGRRWKGKGGVGCERKSKCYERIRDRSNWKLHCLTFSLLTFLKICVERIKITVALDVSLANATFVQDVLCMGDDSIGDSLWPICGLHCFHVTYLYRRAWNFDQGETKHSTRHWVLSTMEKEKKNWVECSGKETF